MRIAGLLLLFSGWVIVLAALALLPASVGRALFLAAGFLLELLGLALAMRSSAALLEEIE